MRAARGGRAGGKDVSGRRLDIARAPLARTTLVEAAAGTGKTWTIAALYVRLLLERRLRTADLLVLTFGRAATAELKSRIRARLVALRGLLESGDLESARESDDALVAHVARTSADPRADALWLALAVETFDQAPVYTIHSFCQRVLTEHAFESGAPFVTELDDPPLKIALGAFIIAATWWKVPALRDAKPAVIAFGGAATTFLTMFFGATGPLTAAFLEKAFAERRAYVASHAAAMTMQHAFKILAFGFAGFAFGQWAGMIAAMILSGFAGTLLGSRLLAALPEETFRIAFRWLLTLLALDIMRRGAIAML